MARAEAYSASGEDGGGERPEVVPCEVYCHSLTDPSILGTERTGNGIVINDAEARQLAALVTLAGMLAGTMAVLAGIGFSIVVDRFRRHGVLPLVIFAEIGFAVALFDSAANHRSTPAI